MTSPAADLKKKPGFVSPALLMTFTQAAEEVCVSPEAPDWNKAAGDAGRIFLEMLQKCRSAPANDAEE